MYRLGGVLLLLSAIVGCGNGTDTSDTTPAFGTVSVETAQYTVAAGDALYAIADRYCVTAAAIVATNGWPDGVDHPLFPGDTIQVPAVGCSGDVAEEASNPGPADTTITNQWLQQYLDDGLVFDPFDGDPGDYDDRFGPLCDAAWTSTYLFLQNRATRDETLQSMRALAVIGAPDVPAELENFMTRYAAFTDEWGPVYDAAVGQARAAADDGADYYETLLSAPSFVSFLAAYDAFPDWADPHGWVGNACRPIADTQGSTP